MTPERWQQIRELLHGAMELKPNERSAYLDRYCLRDPTLRQEVDVLLLAAQEVKTSFLESPALAQAALHRPSGPLAPALDIRDADGRAPVDFVCLGDSLRPGLENLLAAGESCRSEFQEHAASFGGLDGESGAGTESLIGRRLGSYKIVEEIGRGGMGEVYRAFRADDQYRKQVAIKLVRAEQDSKTVVQRFKNERQILASLDHPNIARLIDGGTTEEGAPYFVMELVEGVPVDEYCENQRLTTAERLDLFCQVCAAVQYAHQQLIIHRDIKPSNILVTSDGVPKLLDFGIAKIIDPTAVGGRIEPTVTNFRILTPGYASPEQVKGEIISTASDLYSLGVVLYELLTGRSPYRLANRTPQEIARAVCEVEPEKLSAAVRRAEVEPEGSGKPTITPDVVAVVRDRSPEKLSRRLSGDLDNIVLMALRKEPRRRYASVEQFAQDIGRHLENLPVIARRDTIRYRTSKFVARHRAGMAAAALVALALLAGMFVSLREARIARVERARADRRFNDVRELANSLMFDIHDSIQDLPGSTPARKMLVDRSLKYLDRLASEAGADVTLQRELATAYEKVAAVQGNPFGANLGDTQGSMASYRRAAVIWDSLSKANPGNAQDLVGLAGTYRQLAGLIANSGGANPLEMIQKAVEASERMRDFASPDPRILGELELDYEMAASIQVRTGGDPAGALENLRKALAIAEQRLKSSAQDRSLQRRVAVIHVKIGDSLAELGKRNEALEHSRLGLEIFQSDPIHARSHRDVAIVQSKRGDILLMDGDTAAALQSYRQEQALLEPLAAADPQNAGLRFDLAFAYARVGHALSQGGNGSSARAMLERAMGILEPMARDPEHGEARSALACSHIWMGELLTRTGNMPRALENYRKGAADFLALVTLLPWDRYFRSSLAASRAKAGGVLAKMGRPSEAAAEYQSALEIAKPLALAKPQNFLPWYTIADVNSGLGDLSRMATTRATGDPQKERQRWTEAHDWYQQSVEAWRQIPNPGVISSAGFEVGDPAQVANHLAACKEALRKLESSPFATTESESLRSPKPLH